MFSMPWVITPLRILLIVAFLYSLMILILSIPGSFTHDIGREPGGGHILWPVFLVTELAVLAFMVVIVCTWKLLTMVKHDRIFSDAALFWVNLIVWTLVTGWFVFCALAAYLSAVIFFTPELRDPGVPVVLFGIAVVGGVIVLVVAVLRVLLRRATALQQDLEEVI